ncbi:tRNA 2-selenouridine(34) synthase MnmH [Candidatus Sulfurimonas marisnigri]|uniref:tRNA 2-selenouridine(34) synthase MnmH n=1 Tax=Candidatus Sulfurimonas marisnigri TaxID=2740405 RepID=A0A7S7LYM7_9BACT|nr:tRNA 2-selenouridine(34) synthase MnmH [Candidatus Sulfurimonas marisnigri]QOY53705.1 tRNA 2-selenouridine(34) synthase MnmH [Candidatus Sulfurimonas marisnigri]
MSDMYLCSDFKSIVLNNTPLIDVRAPVEFEKGAFNNATNLLLMNDEERHLVGIHYKEKGNTKAIKLGHELVSGTKKETRIKSWLDFIDANPNAILYCFRGGQRSKISQEWIYEAGYNITRFKGGYKAFRNYLLTQLEESPKHFNPIVLGGRTGSGKTILLKKIENSIDLECLANHRGSSFGRKLTPQPSQINFENNLAYDIIKKLDTGFKYLVFEDEGKNIGSTYMPKSLANYLLTAALVILETPINERIDTTFNEYVTEAQKMYKDGGFIDALAEWRDDILSAMSRIKRRIGGERYIHVTTIFENAYNEQIRSGALDAYKEWVEYLLVEYYDPMYDYQILNRSENVKFRGSSEEVLAYLALF